MNWHIGRKSEERREKREERKLEMANGKLLKVSEGD